MMYMFILTGFVLSLIFHFKGVQNTQWYLLLTATLLAFGLYSSTFGISIAEARRHFRLILTAVTVGVLLKAMVIGTIMALALGDPFGFILGIVLAQIDPLSTAALTRGSRLSQRAKTILSAWSSFDDPVTVILSLYAPALVAILAGTDWQPIQGTAQDAGLVAYLTETGKNLLFAAGAFVLWMGVKRWSRSANIAVIILMLLIMYGIVIGIFSIAIYYFWMLGIAIIGLFMRPPIQPVIDAALRWALYTAAILLGILLIYGVNLPAGILLGAAAFGSQMAVAYLLTRHLPKTDRWHIALAQQNGITAIILALLFESYYPGTVAIVAPAIVTANVLHAVSNRLLDAHKERSLTRRIFGKSLAHMQKHLQKLQQSG